MAAALTVMVATPLLTAGWHLIGLVSARTPPRYLLENAERAHRARLERNARDATDLDAA